MMRMQARGADSSAVSRAIALAALVVLAGQAVVGPSAPVMLRAGVATTSLAVVLASIRAGPAARSVAVLAALLNCLSATGIVWQVVLLAALAGFALLGRALSSVLPSSTWRARGAVPLGWTALAGLVTPLALVGWLRLMKPDLRDLLDAYVPAFPLPVLLLGAVLFVIVNALGEELVWRGIFQDRLKASFGATTAIVLQAISFGLQHAHGFPRGPVGIVLVAIWALLLGWLRERANGLLSALLAHVVADSTIALIVLFVLRGSVLRLPPSQTPSTPPVPAWRPFAPPA